MQKRIPGRRNARRAHKVTKKAKSRKIGTLRQKKWGQKDAQREEGTTRNGPLSLALSPRRREGTTPRRTAEILARIEHVGMLHYRESEPRTSASITPPRLIWMFSLNV